MCNSIKKLVQKEQLQLIQKGILSIGDKLPEFTKKAVITTDRGVEITEITHRCASEKGKWMVLFWWPKDFTFVCPTEIIAFNKSNEKFLERNAILVGASTDTEYVHLGWRQKPSTTNRTFYPYARRHIKIFSRRNGNPKLR